MRGALARGTVRRAAMGKGALDVLKARVDNTLLRDLDADPDEKAEFPNRSTRPVRTGHYVRIEPTPLRKPSLLAYSSDMAARLGIEHDLAKDQAFVKAFAADLPPTELESWCTPYAVSVFGHPIPAPDHFQGYAYGDGRACSIGEFAGEAEGERWELQLKGCGPSPFSRRFDGRAVLRSSVREFLVSEAMHRLGVPTTRALSLVVSEEDVVARPWYRDGARGDGGDFPPNYMIEEPCAITCRAASSFLRVGQVELYARRLENEDDGAREGFEKFVRYCIKREFPQVEAPGEGQEALEVAIVAMLRAFAKRQAHVVTQWIRVGYVQGNMNSDNCLLAGLTMDYGPFGFLERYDPLWNPFTSDPERKFGFERQPVAAHVNLATLVEALKTLFAAGSPRAAEADAIVKEGFGEMLLEERGAMRRAKLGLARWDAAMDADLWQPLYGLLGDFDYTLFWRELSGLPRAALEETDDAKLAGRLERAAYAPIGADKAAALAKWLRAWARHLDADGPRPDAERCAEMKLANPKYVPREWMLAEAYTSARERDLKPLHDLMELFDAPYDEQPEHQDAYYRTTPPEYQRKAGVAFFSCSS